MVDKTSTVALCGTNTGIKEVSRVIKEASRLPGVATGLPYKVDLDSEVATISETGRQTGDNAEPAVNHSGRIARVAIITRAIAWSLPTSVISLHTEELWRF